MKLKTTPLLFLLSLTNCPPAALTVAECQENYHTVKRSSVAYRSPRNEALNALNLALDWALEKHFVTLGLLMNAEQMRSGSFILKTFNKNGFRVSILNSDINSTLLDFEAIFSFSPIFNKNLIGNLNGISILIPDHDEMDFENVELTLDSQVYLYKETKNSGFEISEVYKVTELTKTRFGSWSEKERLTLSKEPIEIRRHGFQGAKLKCVTIADPPFLYTKENEDGTFEPQSGLVALLWADIKKALNFSCTMVPSIDGQWGSMAPDGSFSGMIGMLQRKEVDFAVTTFFPSDQRKRVSDLLGPMSTTK